MKMKKLDKKIEAKNSLENYAYNIRNTIKDEKIKDKISEEEKKIIEEKTNEIISTIENDENLEKEDYEKKENELKEIANPIISKIYQQGNPQNPDNFAGTETENNEETTTGPKIEEVD
jgi:L1 cell adhesion molecule like protein